MQIKFENRPEYLLATVTGSNSIDSVSAYIEDIVTECKLSPCNWVLIDEQLEGPRLQLDDVFDVTSVGAQKLLGVFRAVAFVDKEIGEMADFVETVASNRGMPIKTFRSFVDAERWLLERRTAFRNQ